MNYDEIIFLLGAGASYDAGIPVSSEMMKDIESFISDENKKDNWGKYKNLYYCLKSGIQYGHGIINKSEEMNIEKLVNTMDELIKSYEHPVFPFVGSWVPRLMELAGEEFKNIREFRNLIVDQLENWMKPKHDEYSNYYEGFLRFQKEYEMPIKIFSLNYDLCLEKQCKLSHIECNRGFEKYLWGYGNFDKHDNDEDRINLYKLHGSIDWEYNNEGVIERDDKIDNLAIIFGTSYKLQYLDPFLYLFYEFRRQTLDKVTKIINCIGYSFNDDHINGILGQALNANTNKKIISIQPINDEKSEKERIMGKLGIKNIDNIEVVNMSAKDFLTLKISKDFYLRYLDTGDVPF